MVNLTGLYSKNSSKRRRKKEIGFEDIQKYFDTPIKEASDQLGVSLTQLKRICRECDIPRWPYRKVRIFVVHTNNIVAKYSQQNQRTQR
jgi:hypothetical protein